MREIFYEGLRTNQRGNIKRNVFDKVQIRSSDLVEMPEFSDFFYQYGLGYMRQPPGEYSPVLICKFYSAYAATLISMRKKMESAKGQLPLDSVRV